MKNHEMSLNPEPFELIQEGMQVIETRLNDEKRQLVNPGDTIFLYLDQILNKDFQLQLMANLSF